tara:strand:- start:711 stop:1754 length:1044 start_codon:yes stop_codon:yes gene_type:complete
LSSEKDVDLTILTGADKRFGANVMPKLTPVVSSHSNTSRAFRTLLNERIDNIAAKGQRQLILHDHGQWLAVNRASASIARKYDLKRIVTPRGMLTPWAMSHQYTKKKLAWLLFGRRDFHDATLLHATSEMEACELRDLGARQPIAVIPNGVETLPDSQICEKPKCVLFLSRIHVVKGVSELVEAWRSLSPGGWNLILAGPDEGRLLDQLELTPTDNITYVGQVEGEQKWKLMRDASVFVLPSHSENFGVVVAEALMAGTPVIATHGTPWKSLVDRDCGWWIPMNVDSLKETLKTAMQVDQASLQAMGQRGRTHAIESFGWPSIGQQMAAVYSWMLGLGDMPDCVQLR